MTAAPAPAETPEVTGLALLRLARRIGIAHKRSADAKDDYTSVQAAAQITFAGIRKRGIPNQEIRLPDGSKVAVISIEQGGTSTVIDDELLDAVAAGNDPRDFEDYVEVRAYTDPKVVALIAEHMPDLVSRRIKPYVLAQYKQEIEENGGHVVDRATGERVKVAEITRHDPSGKFAVRFTSKGRIALQDALDSGAINEFGESDADEDGTGSALGDEIVAELDAADGGEQE